MQFLLGILFLAGQGTLDTYHLHIDPEFFDSLYADSLTDLEFPGFVETPAGACSCIVGFRGGTSLLCPKKSWKIELSDPSIGGASHILLDAQYRDMSLMRNALGLLLTRQLGRPAPLTRHVEFFINGVYYGVYVKVERIDDYFFDNAGTGYGPLFKSVSHMGRFAWQPCDTLGTTGFTAERGSDEYLSYVRQLVDAVNLFSPLHINAEDFIAYIAVSLAIRDQDAVSKNYYLHLPPDGDWRFYPWDRDATFGNRWNGEYQPEWIESTTMYCFEISAMTARLLRQSEYREMFADYILQTGYLMEHQLPSIIDSIYLEIRESVYDDSMKQGTNEDFDDAVAVLRSAIIQRGAFVPEIAFDYQAQGSVSMTLSQWEFNPGGNSDTVLVSIELSETASNTVLYYWRHGFEYDYVTMNQTDPYGYTWEQKVHFPSEYDHLLFAVKTRTITTSGESNCYFYYPLYGPPVTPARRDCAPSVRRSSQPFSPGELDLLAPVRYTPDLWCLPVVNSSNSTQDLSLCGFQAGDIPARLFTPDNFHIPAGDTLYLTNNTSLLHALLQWDNIIVGDLVLDSPANTELLMLYPSWDTARVATVGSEVQCNLYSASVILSEICYSGDSGDWIELFNPSHLPVDISEFVLMDSQLHICSLPEETVIDPVDFLVICREKALFHKVNGYEIDPIELLDFGLNSDSDGLYLFNGNDLVFSVLYSRATWPMEDSCVLSLVSPDLQPAIRTSWEAVALPGTPGKPNPGWPALVVRPVINVLWPNPATSGFYIDYTMPRTHGELLLYDISGRLVLPPQLLQTREGSEYLDLPPSLTPGVYFAVVRSRGSVASRKFVILP